MQRRHVLMLIIAGVLCICGVLSLATCDGNQDPVGSPPGAVPTPTAFADAEAAMDSLVTARATWQAPRSLTVEKAERIGLVIGDTGRLSSEIDALIKRSVPRDAGTVEVGPNVRVTLQADQGDASIEPSKAVDQSTTSNVAMLWTWIVRARHPADSMYFTAHVEVPSDKHVFALDVPLTIDVKRTVNFTLHQIFVNWGTWSAIFVAIGGWATWFVRRRRRPQQDHRSLGD
jgi:hypothetical protein